MKVTNLMIRILVVARALTCAAALFVFGCSPTKPPAFPTCPSGGCPVPDLVSGPFDMPPSGSGCASGIYDPIGADVWKCPGTFPVGGARALCADGFKVYSDSDTQFIDIQGCDNPTVPYFFVADVLGTSTSQHSCQVPGTNCSPPASGRDGLRWGCGSLLVKLDNPGTRSQQIESGCITTCWGFDRDITCTGSLDSGYTCNALASPVGLDGESNVNPRIGVLCVRI